MNAEPSGTFTVTPPPEVESLISSFTGEASVAKLSTKRYPEVVYSALALGPEPFVSVNGVPERDSQAPVMKPDR